MANKSEVLKALEWVDQAAADGDVLRLSKAKLALEEELASSRNTLPTDQAYRTAIESFVRKHGREPMEDMIEQD